MAIATGSMAGNGKANSADTPRERAAVALRRGWRQPQPARARLRVAPRGATSHIQGERHAGAQTEVLMAQTSNRISTTSPGS
jgi:hypothetical protein